MLSHGAAGAVGIELDSQIITVDDTEFYIAIGNWVGASIPSFLQKCAYVDLVAACTADEFIYIVAIVRDVIENSGVDDDFVDVGVDAEINIVAAKTRIDDVRARLAVQTIITRSPDQMILAGSAV